MDVLRPEWLYVEQGDDGWSKGACMGGRNFAIKYTPIIFLRKPVLTLTSRARIPSVEG